MLRSQGSHEVFRTSLEGQPSSRSQWLISVWNLRGAKAGLGAHAPSRNQKADTVGQDYKLNAGPLLEILSASCSFPGLLSMVFAFPCLNGNALRHSHGSAIHHSRWHLAPFTCSRGTLGQSSLESCWYWFTVTGGWDSCYWWALGVCTCLCLFIQKCSWKRESKLFELFARVYSLERSSKHSWEMHVVKKLCKYFSFSLCSK